MKLFWIALLQAPGLLPAQAHHKTKHVFIITTDHGRGDGKKWRRHGPFSKGSGDAWLMLLGPEVAPLGEMKPAGNSYQTEIAPTVARLPDISFIVKGNENISLLSAFPSHTPPVVQQAIARK